MNLWLIFITGLTTGGLSCLAMQGGLLASVITNQKESEVVNRVAKKKLKNIEFEWLPVSLFLGTKLLAHLILGFLLGWLGSKMQLSLSVRLFFQTLAALFMLATAANLLELHPVFRYIVLQPPKFLQRWVRRSSKEASFFAPALLGLLTVFIPCGITQAMEVLAITSGSPLAGALILFFFVLGTSPLFALIGVATTKLSERFQHNFMKVAATLLIILATSNLNGVLVVLNSPVTFATVTQPLRYFFSDERFSRAKYAAETLPVVRDGVQRVAIQVQSDGYSPKKLIVRSGVPVELTLQTKDTYSCASSFVLQGFNISLQLGPNDQKTVAFTPTQKGEYPFSCAMGMYTGVIKVI